MLDGLSPKQRELYLRDRELEEAWSVNQWLRSAGSALAAGGGAVVVGYIVAGVTLGYQAAAFFYVAYAAVLATATLLYRHVKLKNRDGYRLRGFLFAMAFGVLYFGSVGIGTFASHRGLFAPQGGWPIAAYTQAWWRVIISALAASVYGLGFRFSSDASGRKIDRELASNSTAFKQLEASGVGSAKEAPPKRSSWSRVRDDLITWARGGLADARGRRRLRDHVVRSRRR